MASKKVQAALLKQKEAKQKKVLFVLVPVFLGLAVWQGPKTFHAITGGNTPPPTAVPATTATVPTPGSAPSTPGAGTVGPSGQLVDTDAPPSVKDGQLSNLGVFPGRDPFAGGPAPLVPPSDGTSTGGTSTGGTGTGTTPTSARLQINGAAEDVSIGDNFPSGDPAFKLVSVTANSALIALASGGKFTNGNTSEAIKVGETLTVNGDDGSSFSITLLSTGSA